MSNMRVLYNRDLNAATTRVTLRPRIAPDRRETACAAERINRPTPQ
ncbi:hypothetical protein [Roseovarius ramblicola]|uniref:Uncharacterized protein n=1 Tax=Roseovarius ramblicola TaxID=2022336 RepID=A0ABV5I2C8_9RHOB